jgi:hypothetical protein
MASSAVKGIEELITCALCNDTFKDPRILSCGHTYCQNCLAGHASVNGDKFECLLHDGVTVAASEINALQVNRTIRELLQLYGK